MPQNCTILSSIDDPEQILALVRKLLHDDSDIEVRGEEPRFASIIIKNAESSLVLNRQMRQKPGDSFSRMVLGMLNYFDHVKTPAKAVKKDVIDRIESMCLAIGVVAEPAFVDAAHHFDYIFAIAAALDAVIWTGSGVIDANGKLLLDGEGNSEVA